MSQKLIVHGRGSLAVAVADIRARARVSWGITRVARSGLSALLLILAPVLLTACSDGDAPADRVGASARPGLPVGIATAETATYQAKVQVIGSTRSDESVDITSSVTETIREIHFRDGQTVKAGDPLVTLSQTAEAALRDQVRISFEDQLRELERLRGLRRSNSISQTEFDRQETATRVAELRLLEVESQIEDRTIRAPFDGTVGLRELSPGALVSPGDRITTLDKTDPLKIDFRIPATHVDKVTIGARIEARATHESQAFSGTIVALDSRITAESRTIEARAVLPNPDGALLPGMLVRITLFGREVAARRIPEEAIVQIGTRHYVFAISEEATASQQEVSLVGREPGWAYLDEGLDPGDRVVVEGNHRLRDGQAVIIKPQPGPKVSTAASMTEQPDTVSD